VLKKDEDLNADIEDFIGYFDITVGQRFGNDWILRVTGRRGQRKGAVEANLAVPWSWLKIKYTELFRHGEPNTRFDPHVYIQYWTGYGENLLEYNTDTSSLRIGIAFHLGDF
jgi:outer membrane phospholipase A